MTFASSAGKNASWLSNDRTTVFATGGATSVYYSTDDGTTWTQNSHVFASAVKLVRETADGELVAFTGSPSSQGKIFKSSGWSSNRATASFSEVQAASASGCYFATWGVHVYGSRVLAAEYGNKDGVNSARYVYMSTDNGDTWVTILDIGNVSSRHVHGVAWDRWWNRIWVTLGDSQTDKVLYSDDEGDSWVTAVTGTAGQQGQCLAILPMESCTLFLTDGTANGVYRINRDAATHADTTPTVYLAYQLSDSGTSTFQGNSAFHAEGFPALLTFQIANAQTGSSRVIGTKDGFRFFDVWTDPITYTDLGAVVLCGPTVNGYLVGHSIDGRYTPNATRVRVAVGDYDVTPASR